MGQTQRKSEKKDTQSKTQTETLEGLLFNDFNNVHKPKPRIITRRQKIWEPKVQCYKNCV